MVMSTATATLLVFGWVMIFAELLGGAVVIHALAQN